MEHGGYRQEPVVGQDFIDITHYDTGDNQAIMVKRGLANVPVKVIRHASHTVYRIKLSDLEKA